jgi:hypothetical protein
MNSNSTTSSERLKIIQSATELISPQSRAKFEDFIAKLPPSLPNIDNSDLQEKSVMLETLNKSNPYLELRRSVEADKDGSPSYNFSLVSHGVGGENREVYLGTFGQEEMLGSQMSLSPSIAKRPSKKSPNKSALVEPSL